MEHSLLSIWCMRDLTIWIAVGDLIGGLLAEHCKDARALLADGDMEEPAMEEIRIVMEDLREESRGLREEESIREDC